MGAPKPAFTFAEGERYTIFYFGQFYHGQFRNGELYLDEYCQQAFAEQLEISFHSWQWPKVLSLSVSELMKEASRQRNPWKPYNPSKPFPVLDPDIQALIQESGLAGKKGITANILLSATVQSDRKTLRTRYVSSLDAGAVTVTDYIITTKTKSEWIVGTRGFYDFLMGATDLLGVLAEVNDPTLLIAGNLVTVPLTLVGQGAGIVNQIGTAYPPQTVQRLERVLKGVKGLDEQVTLLAYAVGYDAFFDQHGNLSFNYQYEYRLL